MNHLDLFSGIGGFSLAASWVWKEEHNIVSFVEIDPFCQKVLKKHWPDVPIHDDIRSYKHDGTIVDLLTGGFPCQPFSCAGKQRSTEDDRYLWPEMLRVIQETQAKFIIGENVSNIEAVDNGMVVKEIIFDLENIGYEVCPPFEIPACAVDADQIRKRYWFLAHSQQCGLEGLSKRHSETNKIYNPPSSPFASSCTIKRFYRRGNTTINRGSNGIPNRVDRLKSLGNAIVPQVVVPIMEAIKKLSPNKASAEAHE